MIVQHFLKWIDTARVAERASAAGALARAFVRSELSFEDRCAAEAALTLLLDDPSPKVRLAMAEALALSARAPAQIVAALAGDQPEIAQYMLALSPILDDNDLIDRVATGSARCRSIIASRPSVSMALAAAIAEVGEAEACLDLLANAGASIAALSFRRIAERFGEDARIREALIRDSRLPADTRHMLLAKLGDVLRQSPFIRAAIGVQRAAAVTKAALDNAAITLIETTPAAEHGALVAHLRLRGEITTAFLVRALAWGKIDFFGAALASLTGHEIGRVAAILSRGRDGALKALFRQAGFADIISPVAITSIRFWREVASGRKLSGPQEASFLMIRALETAHGDGSKAVTELSVLLRSIHLDILRDNARGHALALAAA